MRVVFPNPVVAEGVTVVLPSVRVMPLTVVWVVSVTSDAKLLKPLMITSMVPVPPCGRAMCGGPRMTSKSCSVADGDTLTEVMMSMDTPPPAALSRRKYIPGAAFDGRVIVSMTDEGVPTVGVTVDEGEKAAVAPLGRPETDRVMAELKVPSGSMVSDKSPDPPGDMVICGEA